MLLPSNSRPILVSLLLAGSLCVGSAQEARPLALVGARIELGNGTVLENATLVIQGGKIVSVGEDLQAPGGAKTIDLKGQTVYPGFLDAYTTRGLDIPAAPSQDPRDDKDTAPATMWEKNRKGIRSDVRAAAHLSLKASAGDFHKQGLTAALLAPGSGTLRGICAIAPMLGEPQELPHPDFALEMSFRGGSGAGYPGNVLGIIALMRQTLFDAQRYATLDTDEKDEALANAAPAATGRMPVVFAADTELEIVRAVRICGEFGMKPMIAGGREAYRQAKMLAQQRIPVLVNLNVGTPPSLEEEKGTEPGDSIPRAVREDQLRDWTERAANAAALAEAGVPLAFSSEGDALGDFLSNVRTAIEHGLPRADALRALTATPAELLGVGAGVIRVGQPAFLTIMDGDFADPKSKVTRVVVDGNAFEVKS
ncbi:MAG: amidohydrolase family protein [Fimbriimonadaceae bacterium]|nr:amidohydrolase family protein [Fimbriimonadaceae bacterium]